MPPRAIPWCILKWGFAKMKMSLILISWQTLKYRLWRHHFALYSSISKCRLTKIDGLGLKSTDRPGEWLWPKRFKVKATMKIRFCGSRVGTPDHPPQWMDGQKSRYIHESGSPGHELAHISVEHFYMIFPLKNPFLCVQVLERAIHSNVWHLYIPRVFLL